MTKLVCAASTIALLAVPLTSAHGATRRFIGVITRVDREPAPSVQMSARGLGEQTIQIDGKTAFMKWVTHRPWQQDTRADMAMLGEGRCVEIVLRAGPQSVAQRIRISDEPAGSLFDPCKGKSSRIAPANRLFR